MQRAEKSTQGMIAGPKKSLLPVAERLKQRLLPLWKRRLDERRRRWEWKRKNSLQRRLKVLKQRREKAEAEKVAARGGWVVAGKGDRFTAQSMGVMGDSRFDTPNGSLGCLGLPIPVLAGLM